MTLAIKDAGVWKYPATGKVFRLVGSYRELAESVEASSPLNLWPMRDPAGSYACPDVIGTKDSFYSGIGGVLTSGPHPNPFVVASHHNVVIPGGNPVKNMQTTGCTVECMFKTTTSGPLFGYQEKAVGASMTGGWVPCLYVGTDGKIRGTFYPIAQIVGPKVNDGKYHHVMLTWNPNSSGAKLQRMYVDGLVVAAAPVGTPAIAASFTFNNFAQIGATYNTGTSWPGHPTTGWWYYNGEIYLFAVHNSAKASRQTSINRKPPNWAAVTKVLTKSGPINGGLWIDSGYIGLPGTPAAPTVTADSYYTVTMAWAVPVGGSPVASYEAQLLDEDQEVLTTVTTTSAVRTYKWTGLTPLTKYHMRVRAKSTTGVFTPWSDFLRYEMGQTEQQVPYSEYRTRPWFRSETTGPVGSGGLIVCENAAAVTLHHMTVNVKMANNATPFCDPASNRQAHWVYDGVDSGIDVGYEESPWVEEVPRVTSSATDQGIVLVGPGWAGANLGQGTIELRGDETYLAVGIDIIPAIPNGPW